jgi:hypothetical protein
MKYQLEIYQDFKGFGGQRKYYGFHTFDSLVERLKELRNNEKVLSIKEYHLVYQHPFFLPMCNEVTIYSRREIYKEWVKIPKEQIKTAKQKSYKHNFIEGEEYAHYCLQYEALTEDKDQGYIYKIGATYDLLNSDRQAITKALYDHSKSNRIFNLRLYQYRSYSKEEIQSLTEKFTCK